MRPIAALALGVTVAMMLASAVQAGFGGRPELIVDALKEGPKAIAATAVTLVVMDVLVRGADVLALVVWQAGRGDAQRVLDSLATIMGSKSGGLGATFLGPLALLFGMVGLLITTVVLFMRSSLLYLVAAFAPMVWSMQVSPAFRGASRRMAHVTVALVLAKPAITLTLVVGVKLVANTGAPGTAGASDGAAALGSLVAGFACFAIAGLSPWVVFRLLPAVEHASVGTGIVSGWGRSAMTAAQARLMVKSMGSSAAMSAATRPIASAASATNTTTSSGAGPSASASTSSSVGGGDVASSPVATGQTRGAALRRSAVPAASGSGRSDGGPDERSEP